MSEFRGLSGYLSAVRQFSRNARLYLIYIWGRLLSSVGSYTGAVLMNGGDFRTPFLFMAARGGSLC